jgi:UPF0716 protein FxsA
MRLLLFLAILLVPVFEVWLLIQVGSVIGGWSTVALLIAAGLLGTWLVRREGRRAWRSLEDSLRTGVMPERELADAALVLAGGLLLMMPGFASDVVGFACILPVTRPWMRRLGRWFFERRVKRMAAASPYANLFPPQAGPMGGPYGGKVVHGEVIREGTPQDAPGSGLPRLEARD